MIILNNTVSLLLLDIFCTWEWEFRDQIRRAHEKYPGLNLFDRFRTCRWEGLTAWRGIWLESGLVLDLTCPWSLKMICQKWFPDLDFELFIWVIINSGASHPLFSRFSPLKSHSRIFFCHYLHNISSVSHCMTPN